MSGDDLKAKSNKTRDMFYKIKTLKKYKFYNKHDKLNLKVIFIHNNKLQSKIFCNIYLKLI